METLKVNKRVSLGDITSLIVKVCFKRALRHKKSLLISQEAFFVAEAGLPTLLRMDWRTCKGVLNNRKAFKRLQRY